MNQLLRISACVILALTLSGCLMQRGNLSPEVPPIQLPPPPEVPIRLPVEAMKPCTTIPPVPPISMMTPEAQARAVADYILIVYGAYSICSERHNELTDWITDNIN